MKRFLSFKGIQKMLFTEMPFKIIFGSSFGSKSVHFSGFCLVISSDIPLNPYKSFNIPDLVVRKDNGVSQVITKSRHSSFSIIFFT